MSYADSLTGSGTFYTLYIHFICTINITAQAMPTVNGLQGLCQQVKIDDIKIAKKELEKNNHEMLVALNKSDCKYFRNKYSSLFENY